MSESGGQKYSSKRTRSHTARMSSAIVGVGVRGVAIDVSAAEIVASVSGAGVVGSDTMRAVAEVL